MKRMEEIGTLAASVTVESRVGEHSGCAGMEMAAVLEMFYMAIVDVVQREVRVGVGHEKTIGERSARG